jgi:hypothetical protein
MYCTQIQMSQDAYVVRVYRVRVYIYNCVLQVRARTAAETFARDSFENLLFSIARFREITGAYPKQITVVGYDFKKQR